ncbi:cold shock domain-containing protein [Nonomuraea sp. NN258]|uniref:cold-shock protein n=1 Tax=Nonomuraea antri TaxID=2730852 RepID=UPI0015698F75|nr:cold shock domain-containing protein [Nonomuraea antri]NRQ38236.1 cold shock domain-containing protein [Nonomuraea antri]
MLSGRILRFDEVRGYGFIVPDKSGGPDVFVHSNELLDEKSAFTAGTPVEYEVMEGDRGLKAFNVRVSAARARQAEPPRAAIADEGPHDDEEMCDVLHSAELSHEFTELFLQTVPELTGAQIVKLRESLLVLARKHGWLIE